MIRIVHISDTHVGGPSFVPNLMNRILAEIADLDPDAVLHTGDITDEGFEPQYKEANSYFCQIRQPFFVVPGNHDSRNVGYVHFEDLFGERFWATDVGPVRLVGADSSEPDLNDGRIGRERYPWIREQFDCDAELKVFAVHHHLIPIPGTGRERSTILDAGDLLELLLSAGVDLVLTGHKHVPHVWRLEHLYVANTGTATTLKVRGYTKPCYSVVEYDRGQVRVHRKYPFGEQLLAAHWNARSGEQYHREFEPLFHAPLPATRPSSTDRSVAALLESPLPAGDAHQGGSS